MPEQQINTTQQAGANFIGLQSYTEAEAKYFFGRDKEIDQLTKMVDANMLSIVFGKSGTGKTSLLNAGVFPRLRNNNCLPFRIRLEFNDNSPDLITQVKNVMRSEIDKYGFKVKNYPGPTETLWEYFHKENLWYMVTPILVFDQFEELFTLAQKNSRFKNNELESFWEEMADLIENYIPKKLTDYFLNNKDEIDYDYTSQKTKVIFAFREEYLPEFEDVAKKIPSIKLSRFRLLPMSGKQAYEVVTRTWGNNINPAQAEKIVHYFTNDPGASIDDIQGIEPSLLSQVCTFIEKERITEGGKNISAELLDKYPKERILRSIYNEAIQESNEALLVPDPTHPDDHPPMTMDTFVEDNLITDEGYRTRYKISQKDHLMMPGISVMAEKYMIRLDDNSVELAHDVLTPLIKDEREKKRKVAAQIIATRRARRKAAIWTATGILLAILTYYFTTCKAYQDKAQAFKDKDKAIEDTKQIQTQRDAVKSEFNSVKDSLDRLRKQKIDSPFRGNGELNQFDSARHIKDSLQNNVLINELKQEREKANAFRLEMANVSAQMGILSAQNKKLAGDNNKLQTENAYLNRQYAFYKSQLERSQNRVKALSDSLGAIFIERPVPIPVPPDPIPDANSFILDFKYKGLFKDFDKLGIFMIPYTRDNLKLIRENKEFDIACDPSKISKAPGVKKALFSTKAGQYFFNNVRDGKYLIKFCTLYGNYETVVVKKGLKGSKTIMVAPPIPK